MKNPMRRVARAAVVATLLTASLALTPFAGHLPIAFACSSADQYASDGTITVAIHYRCNLSGLGNAASIDTYYNSCTVDNSSGYFLTSRLTQGSPQNTNSDGYGGNAQCSTTTGYAPVTCNGGKIQGEGTKNLTLHPWTVYNDVFTMAIYAPC